MRTNLLKYIYITFHCTKLYIHMSPHRYQFSALILIPRHHPRRKPKPKRPPNPSLLVKLLRLHRLSLLQRGLPALG